MNWNAIRLLGVIFAIFAIITAINAPPSYGPDDLIPLWGPFERIRGLNRWICMGLAGIVILGVLLLGKRSRHQNLATGAIMLIALHLLIFAKNAFEDPVAALPLLAGFLTMIGAVMFYSRLRTDTAGGTHGVWEPVIWASVGFLAANALQYFVNPVATMIVGGRFNGITSSPQMYALSTAIIAPSLLFEFNHPKRTLPRIVTVVAFLILVFFVILSGSRLSMLLTAFSVLMFYRTRFDRLAGFLIPAVIIGLIWAGTLDEALVTAESRVLSTDNTRGHVWIALWQSMLESPLTGAELTPGGRVGFGENSFLGAGAALGLAGFCLAILVAWWLLKTAFGLMVVEQRRGWKPETSLPIAILSASLAGAFFEASLLGIFTFPLTLTLYCVFASETLIKRFETVRTARTGRRLPRKKRRQRGGNRSAGRPEIETPEAPGRPGMEAETAST